MIRQNLRRTKLIVVLGVLSWAVWVAASSRSGGYVKGPPAGFTWRRGEDTCQQCHDDFDVNRGNGSVTISGLSSVYQLNQRITAVVNVQKPGQTRWGFQLTALTLDGSPAGHFVITDPADTQIIEGPTGRMYAEHTLAGTHVGAPGGASWSLDWVAPASDVGPITFYAAGNAANGDQDRTGDYIYTTSQTISPPSFPEVRLLAPNGDEVLGTGEVFRIRWEASSNTATIALFLVLADGSNPAAIATNLPGMSRSYDWLVPLNVLSTSARILVVGFNDLGSNADDSDSPFSIVDRIPPRVRLLAPSDGSTILAGTRASVVWDASDNIGVVSQDVLATIDGGINFVPLIENLPSAVRSFEWLVPLELVSDRAKIRVVVRDQAGNIGSATNNAPFMIKRPIVPGDVDQDGRLTFHDVLVLLGMLIGVIPLNAAADVNGDGVIDFSDLLRLLSILLGFASW